MGKGKPIITMRAITKRFGGVLALDGVDLDVRAGEVLAIVGDNGAGKSTLIKILTGVYQPTSGEIMMEGRPLVMTSHADAIAKGIDAVYQTLALADHLTPAANMFLGNELTRTFMGIRWLDNALMKSEAERVLQERLGVTLRSMDVPSESLSGGQRQAVAIARAVYNTDLKVLVMDEPTAALGPRETARTLRLIEAVRDQNIGVVVISHSLDDVFQISDRVQVMRRGRKVGLVETRQSTAKDVLGMIIGATDTVEVSS